LEEFNDAENCGAWSLMFERDVPEISNPGIISGNPTV
jgi:hypothetical protein